MIVQKYSPVYSKSPKAGSKSHFKAGCLSTLFWNAAHWLLQKTEMENKESQPALFVVCTLPAHLFPFFAPGVLLLPFLSVLGALVQRSVINLAATNTHANSLHRCRGSGRKRIFKTGAVSSYHWRTSSTDMTARTGCTFWWFLSVCTERICYIII